MSTSRLTNPLLLLLYGLPGSGKSFFARQTSEMLGVPVISSDRIRSELFEKPTFNEEENQVVSNMVMMFVDSYVDIGLPMILDMSLNKPNERKAMREYAKKKGYQHLLIWLQADPDTCFLRAKSRDRRKADDKYATEMTKELFSKIEKQMQAPSGEDALVISGKHLYGSQRGVLLRKLSEMRLISTNDASVGGVAKPELVNLVSAAQMMAGRVDIDRRNVPIQ